MAAIDLASGLTSDNAQALKAAVDNADGQAVSALLNQAAVVAKNMVFNGASWDRLRTPNVFKLLSAVVITSETTIWTLSRDRKTVRMALPPLPLPGMPEPIMLLMDIKAQTVDAMIERLTILRSQMLPALPAPGKRN